MAEHGLQAAQVDTGFDGVCGSGVAGQVVIYLLLTIVGRMSMAGPLRIILEQTAMVW